MRSIIEIGFGLIFVIGAIFNSVYTLKHGDEFYGSFADKALLAPARVLITNVVIPHARVFTLLLISFQLVVAFCILSRSTLATPGLIAGGVFALAAVLVSDKSGAIGNFLMGVAQIYLAYTR